MELFSITCTTCQKRLRVKDESLIGEIMICPKCGSMVLVEQPADDQTSDDESDAQPPAESPSKAPTKKHRVSFRAGEPGKGSKVARSGRIADSDQTTSLDLELALNPPPTREDASTDSEPPPPPVNEPQSDDAVEPPPTDADSTASAVPPPSASPTPEPSADEASSIVAPGSPLRPDGAWESGSSQERRQFLLIGLAAVVGVLLALGVVGWLASQHVNRQARIVQPPQVDPPVTDPNPEDVPPKPVPKKTPQESTRPTDPPKTKPETEVEVVPPEKTEPKSKPDNDPPVEPEDPTTDQPTEPPKEPVAPNSKVPPETTEAPPETETADATSDDPDAKADALSHTLESFAPFIDENSYAPPTTDVPAATDGVTIDPADLASPDTSAPRPEPRKINLAERLQDRIPELKFDAVPLSEFLRFVTSFSTIPISLDPDALALVRVKPNHPVTVQRSNATVGELINAAVGPLQLAYVVRDDQLVITRPLPADGKPRDYRHPVGDLVGNDAEQLDDLIELIQSMVAPDSWESQGGDGSLTAEMPNLAIRQHDTVLSRVLLFCERLRAARSLKPTTKLDPDLYRLEPRWSQADALLQKPLQVRFVEPTLLTRILDRVASETGLQFLIDWQALGQLGWTPDTETTLTPAKKPTGEALMEILAPMDLTYRVINSTTIRVTSPAAVEDRLDIEFYPVAQLLGEASETSSQKLIERITEAMQASGDEDASVVLHIDQPSQYLIAALPQPKQRWLAELLDRWQAQTP